MQTIPSVQFTGKSALAMSEAFARAGSAMDAWYAQQPVTHTSMGESLFQFSTSAYETANEYIFIITIFDTRHRWDLR